MRQKKGSVTGKRGIRIHPINGSKKKKKMKRKKYR